MWFQTCMTDFLPQKRWNDLRVAPCNYNSVWSFQASKRMQTDHKMIKSGLYTTVEAHFCRGIKKTNVNIIFFLTIQTFPRQFYPFPLRIVRYKLWIVKNNVWVVKKNPLFICIPQNKQKKSELQDVNSEFPEKKIFCNNSE